jgi:ERF superfamily
MKDEDPQPEGADSVREIEQEGTNLPKLRAMQAELFDNAFAAAQAAFKPVVRSREVTVAMKSGGSYRFAYAPLETILAACVPALNEQGISFRQFLQIRQRGDQFDHFVVTRLRFKGLIIDDEGIFVFKTDANAQAYGAAVTYAKRMGATLAFGVAADDDNDGNHGESEAFTVRDGAQRSQSPTRTQGRPTREESKRAVAEAAREGSQTKLDVDQPKVYTDQELADFEGKIIDARDELTEALFEGRTTGIVQIWNEIKSNEYIATRVWNSIKEQHPDLHRTLKETVRPTDTKPRGPKK